MQNPEHDETWPEWMKRQWNKVLSEAVFYPNVEPSTMGQLRKCYHLPWYEGLSVNAMIVNGKEIELRPNEDHYWDIAPFLSIPFSSIEYALAITKHGKKEGMHILHLIKKAHSPGSSDGILSSYVCRIPVFEKELAGMVDLKQESRDVKLRYGNIFLCDNENKDFISFHNAPTEDRDFTFDEIFDKWGWGWVTNADGEKGIIGQIGIFIKNYLDRLKD